MVQARRSESFGKRIGKWREMGDWLFWSIANLVAFEFLQPVAVAPGQLTGKYHQATVFILLWRLLAGAGHGQVGMDRGDEKCDSP